MPRTGLTMDVKFMANKSLYIKLCWNFTFAALLIALTACNDKTAKQPVEQKNQKIDLNSQIGWIHNNCLAIKNAGLKSGASITLVSFANEQQLQNGVVVGKAEDASHCPALLDDRKDINQSEGYSFYIIKTDTKLDLAIGLIGLSPNFKKIKDMLTGDIDGDSKQDYFTQCASSEGIHFGVWSGKPYQGKALWSAYYYLGYDIEPNCPPMN